MPARKLKVILVMHQVPLESRFLAEKFLKLSKELDLHLLVWDTKKNTRKFVRQYNRSISARKIHNKSNTLVNAIMNLPIILWLLLKNKNLRRSILTNNDKLKWFKLMTNYLPLLQEKPDIIHYEFGTLAREITLIKQVARAKVIVSFRGYDLNYAGLDNAAYYNEIWDNADGFHFLGNDLLKRARERGYRDQGTSLLNPPAIDTEFFKRSTPVLLPKEGIVFISVSRLVWKKGIEYAILAFNQLVHKYPDIRYKIIGDGPNRESLQFMIHELGLTDKVILTGSAGRTTIKENLEEANVFIQPSVSEGFCNAVIEAQAMGLPVVCTDADGLPENIEDNVTGFVVDKWSADKLAGVMEKFIKNKVLIPEMGNAAIKRATEKYKIEDQIKKFVDFYQQINNS